MGSHRDSISSHQQRPPNVLSPANSIDKGSANEKIFNSNITYNSTTGTYIIAYEVQDTVSVPYTIYFLQSKDGVSWHPVNGAVFGKDVYVACPTLRYVDHYYYLLYGRWSIVIPIDQAAPTYTTRVARSTDLIHWQTQHPALLVPDRKDEGLCTADADLAEYSGDTYILYSIGDQTTWVSRLKYAVYTAACRSCCEVFLTQFTNSKYQLLHYGINRLFECVPDYRVDRY